MRAVQRTKLSGAVYRVRSSGWLDGAPALAGGSVSRDQPMHELQILGVFGPEALVEDLRHRVRRVHGPEEFAAAESVADLRNCLHECAASTVTACTLAHEHIDDVENPTAAIHSLPLLVEQIADRLPVEFRDEP